MTDLRRSRWDFQRTYPLLSPSWSLAYTVEVDRPTVREIGKDHRGLLTRQMLTDSSVSLTLNPNPIGPVPTPLPAVHSPVMLVASL